ncbi:MAG: hypothetical protein ACTHK7_01815, partial [Aureliella sp.]
MPVAEERLQGLIRQGGSRDLVLRARSCTGTTSLPPPRERPAAMMKLDVIDNECDLNPVLRD